MVILLNSLGSFPVAIFALFCSVTVMIFLLFFVFVLIYILAPPLGKLTEQYHDPTTRTVYS